jgi:hypothetical protein
MYGLSKLKSNTLNYNPQAIGKYRHKSYLEKKREIEKLYSGPPPTLDPTDSIDQLKDDMGKAFKRGKDKNNKSIVYHATQKQIDDSGLVIIGGVGQDNRKGMSVLGKLPEIIVGDLKENEVCDPIIIHPFASRKDRIEGGYKYNQDKRHIAKYIPDLAHEYMLPMFYNENKTHLIYPKKEKTFFTFSTGAKDLYMMKNYTIKYLLEKHKLSGSDIITLFTNMYGMTLGGVPDLGNVWNIDMEKVMIFSVADNGVKLPEAYRPLIDPEWELFYDKKYSLIKSPSFCPLPFNITLIGQSAMPIIYDESVDIDGHGMKHYGRAVRNMEPEYPHFYYPNRDLLVEEAEVNTAPRLTGESNKEFSND